VEDASQEDEETFELGIIAKLGSKPKFRVPMNFVKSSPLGLSIMSDGHSSYATAISNGDFSNYATPASRTQKSGSKASIGSRFLTQQHGLKLDSSYTRLLREKELLLPLIEQVDWSGRGQHVEFHPNEDIPLKPLTAIGHGGSAIVDGVLCRRIKLARKTITCNRKQKLENVISEVEHLQRLRHPHIIQLVGSYLQGRKFAILLYPVADWNLSDFIDLCTPEYRSLKSPISQEECLLAMSEFFQCLAHALNYIHSNTMKHLDIKPQNILVRRKPGFKCPFCIYL
jgi:serine/threonine protein kinase